MVGTLGAIASSPPCCYGYRSGGICRSIRLMKSSLLRSTLATSLLAIGIVHAETEYWKFVDPRIGTVGPGNVVIGPCVPYGMIKPSPTTSKWSNTGYSADPARPLIGFRQVHVSGTGGGAKYGNISVLPFSGPTDVLDQSSLRENEEVSLGYYAVDLAKWQIKTEITASPKVAFYRFTFNGEGNRSLKIEAGEALNLSDVFPKRESQFFVGSEIEIVSDHEVRGYNRIRGGWNSGGPYTIYFHAVFDQPFEFLTWRGQRFYPGENVQVDNGEKNGATLTFAPGGDRTVQMKFGISYLSSAKARQNIQTEIPHWDFPRVLAENRQRWETLLSRIEIAADATEAQKRMFYTGLYHTMLMPVDRTGENPLWKSDQPYYDDFYCLWDTYRTSHPLITLIDPPRQVDIVNALLDVYRYEGYLPDARSGNANGRTQGGSNGDVLIADAYVKGLKGIDYAFAFESMLKNADVPPGGNEEQEGRGGLPDYNTLGYVSTRYPRSVSRTVDYAYNDFCIALVAKGLGRTEDFERFAKQSDNWKNLWRADVTDQGTTGFVWPKTPAGEWENFVTATVPERLGEKVPYTATYENNGKVEDWWSGFLYEGKAWDYSLSIPHDVAGLIEKAGGPEAFKARLDTFFDKRIYYVGNEPAFITPNLYHWIGRPDLSSDRIRQIVERSYKDTPRGIPGNDDSGAMSSWLVFRMLGLYPNAGQSYYLISSPLLAESTLHLAEGKTLRIVARGLSAENKYIASAKLNGAPFDQSWIEHADLVKGGVLEFEMAARPATWGTATPPPSLRF